MNSVIRSKLFAPMHHFYEKYFNELFILLHLIALKIQNIRDRAKQIRISINKIRKLYWIKKLQ